MTHEVSASWYCSGEYGISDLYIGLPCVIGKGGIEKVLEITLTDDEKAQLSKSVAAVRELVDASARL